jgi:excisionase family DNA binding protein
MSPELQQELRSFFVSILVDAAKEVLPMLAQASAPSTNEASTRVSEPERLLRPREAAKRMSVSERTLWKLVTSGQIPCVRIGRSVRYDPAALRRWINHSQSSPATVDIDDLRITVEEERRGVEVISRSAPRTNRQRNGDAIRADKAEPKGRAKGAKDRVDERPRSAPAFFAKRLGLPPEQFPRFTNGDLMRAADVDIATMHNWIYRGGELPEANFKKLEEIFKALAAKRGEDD